MVSDFAEQIGVWECTLEKWRGVFPEFEIAYKRAMDIYRKFHVLMGNYGVYHPIFCMFTAKNQVGMRDSVDLTSNGSTIQPQFIAHDNKRLKTKKTG